MFILCKNTCISKDLGGSKKPKFRKYKDTLLDVFNSEEAVAKYIDENIFAKEDIHGVNFNPSKVIALIKKYDNTFLKQSVLFSTTLTDKAISVFNLYFIYYKEEPIDFTRKEILTDSSEKYNKIKNQLVEMKQKYYVKKEEN